MNDQEVSRADRDPQAGRLMMPIDNSDDPNPSPEDLRVLARRVDDLGRHIEDLARLIRGRPGGPERLAAPDAPPCATPQARDAFPTRGVDRLVRLLGDQERRAADLARRVGDHNRLLRTICLALKELDDPYGLGVGLDKRLGLEDRDDEGEES